MAMAHYVMSDIHGEADRFHAMLEKIRFSPEDTLYILGDVIDRGADGIRLLLEIMEMPNAVMLLGNHEYMMREFLSPDASDIQIRRWNRNGNASTLAAYRALKAETQQRILDYLNTRLTHLETAVGGRKFYLVHGFPGENVHDEVWSRPELDTPNPRPGYQLVIGHTPVLSMIKPEEKQAAYAMELENRGEHLKIVHTPGFINIDCGCGHALPIRALACLRLEDLKAFYV